MRTNVNPKEGLTRSVVHCFDGGRTATTDQSSPKRKQTSSPTGEGTRNAHKPNNPF